MAGILPAIAAANVISIAREYTAGVSLVSAGRPDLMNITIQNRDNQSIYFWHGPVSVDLVSHMIQVYLPEDPADWTAQEATDAGTFMSAYGEEIAAGERFEPMVSHKGIIYSYVASGTAKAHVRFSSSKLEHNAQLEEMNNP